jgi:tRNA threonylcarbamoyladenosine biosynthesis protein TsaB
MITLAIDASTYVGSVAVLRDDVVLAEETTPMRDPEHERLMPAVASALDRAHIPVGMLDRVVCGAGPGSFTSLRIAGSIAKGIATGAGKPLYAVPSMALIVGGAGVGVGRYLVAVDALRGEFYAGLYHVSAASAVIELEPPRIIAAGEIEAVALEYEAKIVSPSEISGAMRASPRAAAVLRVAAWLDGVEPVNIGSWEPAYGRLAEAQVKWESAHGRPLPVG